MNKGSTEKIPGIDFPLVLYDGFCNLCSRAVELILKHERKPVYYFLSLQSPKVMELGTGYEVIAEKESVILIEQGKVYEGSTAALRIARKLKFPYFLLYVFIYIPRLFRDPFYDYIAARRYKWFGKKQSCYVPVSEWKHRFLD